MHISMTLERRQEHCQSQAVVNTEAHSLDASLSFDDMLLLARTAEPIRDAFEQRKQRTAMRGALRRQSSEYAGHEHGLRAESDDEAGKATYRPPRVVDGRMPVERRNMAEDNPFITNPFETMSQDEPGVVRMESTEPISPTHEDHFGSRTKSTFVDHQESPLMNSPYEMDWYAHHFGGASDGTADEDGNESIAARSTTCSAAVANTISEDKGKLRHEFAQEQRHQRFQEQQHQRREQQRRQQERRRLRRQKRHGAFSLSWSLVCENGAMIEVIDDRLAQQAVPLFKLQVSATLSETLSRT